MNAMTAGMEQHLELTLDDLAGPPLPDGPLRVAWQSYLDAWAEGRRSDAQTTLTDVVGELAALPSSASDRFAWWVCELLFDRGRFRYGQWGGAMSYRDGTWHRPVAPALTAHLLSTRVVLPYLLAALPENRIPHVRWLYQFTVGQGYRLPPADMRLLLSALEQHCGTAEPVALLARVKADPIAQRWLNDNNSEDYN